MSLSKVLGGALAVVSLVTPIVGSGSAIAATATGTLGVTINITSGCVVDAGPNTLDFGSTGAVIGANVDVQTTFNVTCDNTTTYTVALNGGVSGSITAREMRNGANAVSYQLYTNTARTTVFGDGTNGITVAGTGTGLAQAITVYGRVAPQTAPATGVYNDTVTITVTY